MTELVTIGTVLKISGFKGDLVIRLNEGYEIKLKSIEWLFINREGSRVPYRVQTSQPGKKAWNVKLKRIDSEEAARKVVGMEVLLRKHDLEDATITEAHSVFGYSVIDSKSGTLGAAKRVETNANNPLLLVNYGKKELMIPFRDGIVTDVDHKRKIITVDCPDGLLDLN